MFCCTCGHQAVKRNFESGVETEVLRLNVTGVEIEGKWGILVMTNKIFKTESYSDSVKKYETTLLHLGKKSKGNFGDRAKFFETDDDVRADDDENSFKDQTNIKYVSWG